MFDLYLHRSPVGLINLFNFETTCNWCLFHNLIPFFPSKTWQAVAYLMVLVASAIKDSSIKVALRRTVISRNVFADACVGMQTVKTSKNSKNMCLVFIKNFGFVMVLVCNMLGLLQHGDSFEIHTCPEPYCFWQQDVVVESFLVDVSFAWWYW